MTGEDHGAELSECGRDVAAYALGALDPPELEAFHAHLETCVVCRDELAGLERVVEVLSMSAPQHRASRQLRRRIMDAVEHEPRLARRAQHRGGVARFSMPRPALALGAALAALAIAVISVGLRTSGTADTRVYPAQVSGNGSAEVTVTGNRAELIVHHFSPPPEGQIYEVWLQRPGRAPEPTSALFSTTATGEGHVDVPGNVHGVDALMVTPEPAGGSRVPTHPAAIRAQLS